MVEEDEPSAGGRARALAALGAEVEAVARKVAAVDEALKREKRRIGAGVAAAKELVDQREKLRVVLDERLPEVEDGLRQLAETVRRLAGEDGEDSPGVGSWMQADAEAEQTVAMLRDLGEWVATVLLHYPEAAAKLPSCWWRHPDLVEHLLVLRACWGVAFDAGSGTALARADWLERRLPVAVQRIGERGRSCQTGHSEPKLPGQYRPPTPEQLAAEAQGWAARGRELRPAPPAGQHPPAGPPPGYPPSAPPPGYGPGPGGGWPGQPYPGS